MTTSIPRRSAILYVVTAVIAVVLDQVSKLWVLQNFTYRERLNVIPNFFDLTLVYNPGAAFSFLAGAGGWQKYFFLLLAAVICAYLIYSIAKRQFGFIGSLGAAAIIGGAAGNVIDRLMHGHVVDFLLFYVNEHYYPAFNIADSFICVGAALLIWDGLRQKRASDSKD